MKLSLALSIVLLFCQTLTTLAQYPNMSYKQAVEAQKKTLLVSLEEEDPAKARQLANKPEELKAMREFVNGKNEALKNAIKNVWTLTSVEVKTKTEAAALLKSKPESYVSLQISFVNSYSFAPNGRGQDATRQIGYSYSQARGGYSYNYPAQSIQKDGTVPTLSLTSSKKQMLKVNLPTEHPSEGEIMYAVGHLQAIWAYVAKDKDNDVVRLIRKQLDIDRKAMKEMTLLVNKDDVKEGVTEEEIKKAYTFPIKITDLDEIDKILIAKTKGYAVLKLVPVEIGAGNMKAHTIISAEDYTFYYFDYASAQTINGIRITSKVDKLREKDFRNINKEVKNSK